MLTFASHYPAMASPLLPLTTYHVFHFFLPTDHDHGFFIPVSPYPPLSFKISVSLGK